MDLNFGYIYIYIPIKKFLNRFVLNSDVWTLSRDQREWYHLLSVSVSSLPQGWIKTPPSPDKLVMSSPHPSCTSENGHQVRNRACRGVRLKRD